jgi:hypothetical protein
MHLEGVGHVTCGITGGSAAGRLCWGSRSLAGGTNQRRLRYRRPSCYRVEKLHERSGTAKATEIAVEYLTVCTALAVLLTSIPLWLLVKPELHR